jgi:hypothetical protein
VWTGLNLQSPTKRARVSAQVIFCQGSLPHLRCQSSACSWAKLPSQQRNHTFLRVSFHKIPIQPQGMTYYTNTKYVPHFTKNFEPLATFRGVTCSTPNNFFHNEPNIFGHISGRYPSEHKIISFTTNLKSLATFRGAILPHNKIISFTTNLKYLVTFRGAILPHTK